MLLCLLLPTSPAHAQQLGLWLDASASTTQPPAGVSASDATFGLLGLRAVAALTDALSMTARGQAGAGARAEDGRWLFGEATGAWTAALGPAFALLDASAFALSYDRPFDYDARAARVRPGAGAGIGPFSVRLRGDLLRGDWSSRYPQEIEGPLPLPAPEVTQEGTLRIDGGDVAVATYFKGISVELEIGLREAENGTLDGRYRTASLAVSVPLGRAHVFGGVRAQDAVGDEELGGELGAALALGDRLQLIGLAVRSVTDPLYGTRSGPGFSLGASIRLGEWERREDAVVAIGSPADGRRAVTLRVERSGAAVVEVAGSFNAWTPVPMERTDDDIWSVTLHLEPGTYTFAFRLADGTWFVPQDAPGVVDDGFGQDNATLVVPPL